MGNDEEEELVSRLSYDIIKQLAPNEVDLFDDIMEEFLKDPEEFSKMDQKEREKMLGFIGGGVGEQFISMTVLPLVWGAIKSVGKEGLESLKKETSKAVTGKIEETIGGKEDITPSKDKIMDIREHAFNTAVSMGMNEDKAGVLADSYIGKLVMMGGIH